uniref:Decapping nuclease n=1 Tax=Parascaris equorum TaxID=6256 RepID=A0A914S4M7_PAREQ
MATLMSLSEYVPPESFPSYKLPSPIAEYSVTKERNVVPGRAEAKYFYGKVLDKDAAFHFDLSEGFENFESKDDLLQDERLDILSKWLISRAAPNVGLSEWSYNNTEPTVLARLFIVSASTLTVVMLTLNVAERQLKVQKRRLVCFHADFVCYRGLLTRIASTPYDVVEDWIVGAVYFLTKSKGVGIDLLT